MRYEIKSISVWAYLKVSFFLNLAIGFIVGLFEAVFIGFIFTVMGTIPVASGYDEFTPEVPIGVLIVILPFLFSIGAAVFGTLFGLVIVAIYNLIARIAGGVEFDLQPVTAVETSIAPAEPSASVVLPPPPAPPPPPPSAPGSKPFPEPPASPPEK